MLNYLLLILPALFLIGSIIVSIKKFEKGKNAKKTVVSQILSFCAVFALCFIFPMVTNAAGVPATDAAAVADNSTGLGYLAAAAATGLSCIGGGIAVASAAPAAIGATSEDAKNFGKSIIFVALGEGIALYGMLISIMIISKL